ncbi:HAD-IIA family hydrolase [Sulfuracidifex metallicus]|uniref:HAD-IIA family hydrolase n=1 Tax=Sulfuracidifex metallicus DSM 6482 = JCM 9184 TaxID=523847 RepID=A0A6A9QKX1_SULME|nr:HAD-IIA family hydrolase [Sulfuracidifex metallicus]MUN29274.1 HAD-IIA family hydrolase [Sulfuracidifex metallicus DSM 6482 = JCM 9184]WOE50210.1 HAD-IIA family hydrolase [Sulfuracidifex metallicus DSM 6482 = JCM 9184]
MNLGKYDLIVSDVDGVILMEGEPIWENIKALRELTSKGKKLALVTNNSGFNRVLLSRQISYLGLDVNPSLIITSSVSAATYLKERGNVQSVFVVGEEGLSDELKGFGFKVLTVSDANENLPDSVVVGLDRLSNYDKLSLAMRCISKGSLFVATNMDKLWPSKEGLKLGAGALVKAISFALNREPDFVAGKPNPWMLKVVMERSGVTDKDRIVVIGDQLETDVKMGNDEGIDTILVQTGISKEEDIDRVMIKPTYIVNNLLDLL